MRPHIEPSRSGWAVSGTEATVADRYQWSHSLGLRVAGVRSHLDVVPVTCSFFPLTLNRNPPSRPTDLTQTHSLTPIAVPYQASKGPPTDTFGAVWRSRGGPDRGLRSSQDDGDPVSGGGGPEDERRRPARVGCLGAESRVPPGVARRRGAAGPRPGATSRCPATSGSLRMP
jgi:hypothetical protein